MATDIKFTEAFKEKVQECADRFMYMLNTPETRAQLTELISCVLADFASRGEIHPYLRCKVVEGSDPESLELSWYMPEVS